jgi:hypothetical protein
MPRIPPGHSELPPSKATTWPDSPHLPHNLHDTGHGPHSGRWLLPLIGIGLCVWVMLGASLVGTDGAGAAPALLLPAPQP